MVHASACSRISDGTSVEYVAMFSVGPRKSFPSAVNQWGESKDKKNVFQEIPKEIRRIKMREQKYRVEIHLRILSDRGRGN